MGIVEVIGLFFSIIVAVAPTLLAHINAKQKEQQHDSIVLVDRDRTVLRDGLIKLRGKDQGL